MPFPLLWPSFVVVLFVFESSFIIGFVWNGSLAKNYTNNLLEWKPSREGEGRIEFHANPELLLDQMGKKCNSFLLCYESHLDANNRRVRPQFTAMAHHNSNVSRVCRHFGGGDKPVWHTIGLRICIDPIKSSVSTRFLAPFALSKPNSCYAAIIQNVSKVENTEILRIQFNDSVVKNLQLPTANFCLHEKCPKDMGLDLDKEIGFPYSDGAKMLRKESGFWLTALDMLGNNSETGVQLQLIYHKDFEIETLSDGTDLQITIGMKK